MEAKRSISGTTYELFETEVCTRCGGCGRYSWCPMHGDTCFKCSGYGVTFTKRGHAAANLFNGLRKFAASEIQVGDVLLDEDPFGAKWRRVVGIESGDVVCYRMNDVEHTSQTVCFSFATGYSLTQAVNNQVMRRWRTMDERDNAYQQAIALQNSLTKTGKPRRR